jgi:hypothetical protein
MFPNIKNHRQSDLTASVSKTGSDHQEAGFTGRFAGVIFRNRLHGMSRAAALG